MQQDFDTMHDMSVQQPKPMIQKLLPVFVIIVLVIAFTVLLLYNRSDAFEGGTFVQMIDEELELEMHLEFYDSNFTMTSVIPMPIPHLPEIRFVMYGSYTVNGSIVRTRLNFETAEIIGLDEAVDTLITLLFDDINEEVWALLGTNITELLAEADVETVHELFALEGLSVDDFRGELETDLAELSEMLAELQQDGQQNARFRYNARNGTLTANREIFTRVDN